MKRSRFSSIVITMIVVLGLLLGACQAAPATQATSKEPVKLVVLTHWGEESLATPMKALLASRSGVLSSPPAPTVTRSRGATTAHSSPAGEPRRTVTATTTRARGTSSRQRPPRPCEAPGASSCHPPTVSAPRGRAGGGAKGSSVTRPTLRERGGATPYPLSS